MTSFILPVYLINNELLEMTQRCLLSLNQDRPDEVIIVNDGSPLPIGEDDPFIKMVDGKVISLPKNYGYTVAVNTGLKAAQGDIIIIGNNDLLFTPGWLGAIQKPLKEGFDISSIQVVDEGQPVRNSQEITTGDKFGSLFALKRKVYEKLGGLDETLGRGYFTDLDLHKRAEKAGFKVGKYWGSVVTHSPKSTFKIVDPEDKYYLEAMKKFEKKWGSTW